MNRRTQRAIATFDSYISGRQKGVRTNFSNIPRGGAERRVSNGGSGG